MEIYTWTKYMPVEACGVDFEKDFFCGSRLLIWTCWPGYLAEVPWYPRYAKWVAKIPLYASSAGLYSEMQLAINIPRYTKQVAKIPQLQLLGLNTERQACVWYIQKWYVTQIHILYISRVLWCRNESEMRLAIPSQCRHESEMRLGIPSQNLL